MTPTATVSSLLRRPSDNPPTRAEVFAADGRFQLRQETNANSVRPATQWRGFVMAPSAPVPHPLVWGASPALPDALELACRATGAHAMTAMLEADPTDRLARALAALGRAVTGRKS